MGKCRKIKVRLNEYEHIFIISSRKNDKLRRDPECDTIEHRYRPFTFVHDDTIGPAGLVRRNTFCYCNKKTRAGAIYWICTETAV